MINGKAIAEYRFQYLSLKKIKLFGYVIPQL